MTAIEGVYDRQGTAETEDLARVALEAGRPLLCGELEEEREELRKKVGDAEQLLGEYGAGGSAAGLVPAIHNLAHRAEKAEQELEQVRGWNRENRAEAEKAWTKLAEVRAEVERLGKDAKTADELASTQLSQGVESEAERSSVRGDAYRVAAKRIRAILDSAPSVAAGDGEERGEEDYCGCGHPQSDHGGVMEDQECQSCDCDEYEYDGSIIPTQQLPGKSLSREPGDQETLKAIKRALKWKREPATRQINEALDLIDDALTQQSADPEVMDDDDRARLREIASLIDHNFPTDTAARDSRFLRKLADCQPTPELLGEEERQRLQRIADYIGKGAVNHPQTDDAEFLRNLVSFLSESQGYRERFLALKDRLFSQGVEACVRRAGTEENPSHRAMVRRDLATAWNAATGHDHSLLATQPVPGNSGGVEEAVDELAKRLARHAEEIATEQRRKGYVRTDWKLSDVRQRFRGKARRILAAFASDSEEGKA